MSSESANDYDAAMLVEAELVDAPPSEQEDRSEEWLSEEDVQYVDAVPRTRRRVKSFLSAAFRWLVVKPFQLASLIVLLAVLSAAPILQLVSLGYLLEVSGRVARTGRLRDGLFLLEQAGKVGAAAVALLLLSLPIRLISTWAQAAELVNPQSNQANWLRVAGTLLVFAIASHVGWVWFRGGRLRSYFRPRPIEFMKNFWRVSIWVEARDRLWNFVASMQLGKLFWLGTRGMIATLLWLLVPASILIGATRNGQTGLAGLVGAVGFVLMGIVLLYLPFLQVRFAEQNRFRAMFEVRAVREAFRASPIMFWLALTITLLFAIPLYLLKIEATPQEVVWLPCIVMVAFMLPARLMTGYAVGRGERRRVAPGPWHKVLRIGLRFLCLPIIFGYLLFVFLSGFTSWDGLATWLQQHALLVPVPFQSGV
ncbi:MAG: DUF4013 domain-containing protein [Pirellulaceae bacterium]